ncbi:MAG: tetratricopeptide repeat protein [Ignavibacteriae bacterium]|nr:tetratricopeptide repeat protein [Ignavibacteriota bacterium]
MSSGNSLPSIYSEIDTINLEALAFFNNDQSDQALETSAKGYDLAVMHKYQTGICTSLGITGKIYYKLLKYEDALKSFHQSVEVSQEIGNSEELARALTGIGAVYYSTGRIQEALEEFLKGYTVLELAGLTKETLPILSNIVPSYNMLGEFFVSIQFAEKQLAVAKLHNASKYTAKALSSLGELYFHIADYETSLNYSNEGLALAIEIKDLHAECMLLANIGAVYYLLDNYTSALDSMMRSIAIAEQHEDGKVLTALLNYVCCVYGKMNNGSLALNYAMRALSIDVAHGDRVGEAYTLHNIACVFEQSGDIHTALEYAHKSRGLLQTSSIKEAEAETLLLIAKCYEKLNNFTSALEYAENALLIAEDINSHRLLQSSLCHLESISILNGDNISASRYSFRLTSVSKIITKEEQRKNAEKLLLEAQIKKTREQAEMLIASSMSSLSTDFLNKTNTLKQQGFALTTTAIQPAAKKVKINNAIAVQTFGHFSVTIGNRQLTNDDWQRKKARDIFKILLINHRKSVTIDELIDFLWSDSANKNLIPTLWNSVSYIRKALEPDIKPHTPSSYIKISDRSYMLDLGTEVSIDFLQFKDILASSRQENNVEVKMSLLENAVALYTGEFLKEDSFEEWASFERESMKELFLEATIEIGNYYFHKSKIPDAVIYARMAIETDKIYEEGYKLLFTALANNQQISELTKAWKLCQKAYKKELGVHPPRFLEKLLLQ